MPDVPRYGAHALRAHRILFRVGLSLGNVFAWIFVFLSGYATSGSVERALAFVVILYALSQAITLILTPASAAHLRRGVRQSLIWGTLIAAVSFIILGAAFAGLFGTHGLWGVTGFAVMLGAYRALYWVPYRLANAAQPSETSETFSLFEILIALMPLFAALTLISFSNAPLRLLFGAAAFMVVSIIPALIFPDTRERFSWPYQYAFQQLFRKKHAGLVLSSFLEGLQGTALLLVWPLAVFLIVGWSYITLGFVFSITLLLLLLLRGFYRRLRTVISARRSPVIDVTFALSAWVARAAAGTPFGVILADTYSYASLPLRGANADPFTYEHAADRGSFLDEYTALKEMSMAAGRLALCVVIAPLAFLLPVPITLGAALFIAGGAAGLNVLLSRVHPVAAY